MPLYEHVFLARQDISQQQVEGLVQEYRTIIEGGGGTIGRARDRLEGAMPTVCALSGVDQEGKAQERRRHGDRA